MSFDDTRQEARIQRLVIVRNLVQVDRVHKFISPEHGPVTFGT